MNLSSSRALLTIAIAASAGVPAVATTAPKVPAAAAALAEMARPLDLSDLGAPTFSTFTSRDGLPESVIESIQTDSAGFVWSGSPEGLARYDGHRWSAPAEAAFSAGAAGELTIDSRGAVWAAFRERGLAHLEDGVWQVENRASGLATERFRRVVELRGSDGSAELWALSMDGLLLHRVDGRWQVEPGTESLPPGPLLAAAATQRLGGGYRLWVGTFNEGVWFREEAAEGAGEAGRWQQLRDERFDPAQIEFLLATESEGHEELWISTFGSGLWRLDESGLRSWGLATGDLPTDEFYTLAETRLPSGDRAIWAASRSGLVRIHNDRAQIFDRRHGLPSNVVRGLSAWRSPDGIDVLWVATESGVARTIVGASQWQTASLMGASSAGVFGVLIEPDGRGGERLWVAASADGVGLYEAGVWHRFGHAEGALPDADARRVVRILDERGQGTLWVGQRNGYLLRVRERPSGVPEFVPVPTPWERHPGQAVLDLLGRTVDGRHELWFATRQSGIYRLVNGVWTAFRPEGAVGQWRTGRLVEQVDTQGRSWLWASSNLGLGRYDGERWELFGREIGLAGIDLIGLSLLPDATGRAVLWAGSAGTGVARIDVSDPRQPRALDPRELPPPPDLVTYGAVRDSRGRIYVCTNNGVQQLTPSANGFVSRVFTRRDGMVHEECNTNSQFVDANDRFWTGTLGGLTVFDPERDIPDRHAKPLRLTGVSVGGEARAASDLRLPFDVRDLRIDWALLSWQRESESRFRTQLVGYDRAPGDWTAHNFRSWNTLPPGRYTLRVEGRDYAGNESVPLVLAIEIVPAWWQRDWARLLFVLAGVVAASGVVAWRTRRLHAQRRRLEEQVAQRTTELHRANERLLELSYKDALTGLANRRRLLERLEPAAGVAFGPAAFTALIFVDVDNFKIYNDRFGHPAGDEALRSVAGVLRRCLPPAALAVRYGGEEFACLVFDGDLAAARGLAEQIRAEVERVEVPVPGTATVQKVTISAGVAGMLVENPADAHRLLRDADIALYQAKRDGRNCVRG